MSDPARKAPFLGLKRCGIAGFSGGGDSTWLALAAALGARGTRPKVRELYLFDVNGWPAGKQNAQNIVAAAKLAGGDFRLRVVPTDSDKADLSAFAKYMQTLISPDLALFPHFFDLAKNGQGLSTWYAHFAMPAKSARPNDWFQQIPGDTLTWDAGARHQFSIFGGEDSSSTFTFLRKFIDVSDF